MRKTYSGIRLFVEGELGPNAEISLERDQTHYLSAVMRRAVGDELALFNGRDGEWRAQITALGKRNAVLSVLVQTAPQVVPPDIWMLFAPLKKDRTDFIVEKSVELGACALRPVFTEFTNATRVRPERIRANMIEAAEQCGGVFLPELMEAQSLLQVLEAWPADRRLLFCDERRDAQPIQQALATAGPGPWAILIGPEGGFSEAEAARLRTHPNVLRVTLGPRVLRADTAAVAALSIWQTALGDWG